jgi:hypothetical protein
VFNCTLQIHLSLLIWLVRASGFVLRHQR